jgi:hypothetical protein
MTGSWLRTRAPAEAISNAATTQAKTEYLLFIAINLTLQYIHANGQVEFILGVSRWIHSPDVWTSPVPLVFPSSSGPAATGYGEAPPPECAG